MKWENIGHEFDYLKPFFDEEHTYAVWGAGTFGITFVENIANEISIKCFIDSSADKKGQVISDLIVLSPEEFFDMNSDCIVLVATGYTNAVYSILNKYGYLKNHSYFHIDEFIMLYNFFNYNKVCVSDITIDITQCCTLKCEFCNGFIPQICKPRHYSIESIKENIISILDWVDEITVLGLCGGDAMLHPKFCEILKWIGSKYYPQRVKNIEIYSNAVIIPSEEAIGLFKDYNIYYRFTDYSGASGRQNICEVVNKLEENGIKYDHATFSEWYDCGYPQKSNGVKEDGLIKFFDMCDRKSCHTVWDKKLFPCGMCINADIIDYCKYVDSDYFDLEKYDSSRRAELLEFYSGYSEKGYYEYCKMCNGSCNVNKHAIPVGIQLNNG